MKEINININDGDVQKIANAIAALSGVVAVHTEQNRITAFCGDRMGNEVLMSIISEMQSGDSGRVKR